LSNTTSLKGRLKRFYQTATARETLPGETPAGFAVLLDGKRLTTPAGKPLVVAWRPLAEALAAEWDAQEGEIRPLAMPLMQLVSTALDRVQAQREAVLDEVAA
jgi:chaperone required for assembly of F1-ATPase